MAVVATGKTAIRGQTTVGGFNPATLFSAGEQGVWYDPSDPTTLFQDAAGTTPVTAMEQPVGLVLDKSKGLALGSELVTNGSFTNGTTGWTALTDGTFTASNGIATLTEVTADFQRVYQAITCVVGQSYYVSGKFTAISNNINFYVHTSFSGTPSAPVWPGYSASAPGTLPGVFTATATTMYVIILLPSNNGSSVSFTDITIKSLAGNHATQSTTASRPVLSARVNYLTQTEDLTKAAWSKGNCTATATVITATATSSVRVIQSASNTLTTSWTYRAKILKGRNFVAGVNGVASGVGANFNGTTGAYVNSTSVGSVWTLNSYSCVDFPGDSGYWLVTITVTNSTVDGGLIYGFSGINNSSGTTWLTGWDAVVGDTLTVTNQDLRPANIGVGLPAYQRVGAATYGTSTAAGNPDYDTNGFPVYLKFDGTASTMATASVNFTSTDKMSVIAGLRKNSDAAVYQLVELSASVNTNNGSFGLFAPSFLSGNGVGKYVGSLRGTTQSVSELTTYVAPITNVLSARFDIAGATYAAQNNYRVNGAAPGAEVTNTALAGTGNFGNYPIYIGARGGSSLYFNGNIYGLIIRGAASSAAQISGAENWLNGKTGAYL